MWTTRWAVRSVDDVLSEIDFGILTYKATNFDFQDLTAIIKKNGLKNFVKKLLIDAF